MIPVYQAIEFKDEMIGGSTRPWQVTVLKNGAPAIYVVKLYTEKNNEQNCTVFKECVCKNNSIWAHNYKRHIFYEVLRNLNFTENDGLFDDFSYYLRDLVNFKSIDTIMEQLDDLGHPIDAYLSIKDYLCTVQEKTTTFIQLITDTIQ